MTESGPDSAEERVVFRSGGGTVWMVLTIVVCALLLGDLVVRGSLIDALLIAPWLLLLVWFVYLFVWAPRIVATPDGVSVHNVLRITRLSWSAIASITSRWQIEFRLVEELAQKPLQAWGAPTQRPSRSPKRTHPSANQLERLRIMLDEAPEAPVERTVAWDVPGLVAGAVIVVWAIISILVAL